MNPLTGYNYCKSFTIVHSPDGSQTNYQMKLTIIKGAGVSSAGTLYLDNKSTNWPNDIRFTKSDGTTLLDFWREESDATDGTWWIEVDSIPDPTDFAGYVHVGNAVATDASDGDTTFPFFDDFPGVALDGTKWDIIFGVPVVASSVVTMLRAGGVDCGIKSKYTSGVNYATRQLFKSVHALGDIYDEYIGFYDVSNSYGIAGMPSNSSISNTFYSYDGGISGVIPMSGWIANTFQIVEIRRNSTTDASIIVDGSSATVNTHISNTITAQILYQGSATNGAEVACDWSLFRKYTANEPSFGAWGTWERISPYTGPIIITRPKYKIEVRDANGVLKWVL